MSVRIPKPCHADAGQMTPVAGGKFCGACSQVVTDFTKMTDAQLIDWMANHRGGCGSFRPDQLNRQLIALDIRKAPFGMKWLLSLLIVTGCIRDEDRKQNIKPLVERTLGEPFISDTSIIIDSPVTYGGFLTPSNDPDTPSKKSAVPSLLDSASLIETIVQGGVAFEPAETINTDTPQNNSGIAVVQARMDIAGSFMPQTTIDSRRAGIAIGGARPGKRPEVNMYEPETPVKRNLWQRIFGRR